MYQAKVEIYHENLAPPRGLGWKVKNNTKGLSTFFPDDMIKEELIDAISYAFRIKKRIAGDKYRSLTQRGIVVEMFLDANGNIETCYPIYNP